MYGKICTDCKEVLSGKHPTICKPCMARRSREWRTANPERARAAVTKYQKANKERLVANRRRPHVKNTYGITVDQFDEILSKQGGCCAICRTDKPNGPGKHFFVDHNHITGRVRGLLCANCNFVIGHAGDDKEVLRAAIAYLQNVAGS